MSGGVSNENDKITSFKKIFSIENVFSKNSDFSSTKVFYKQLNRRFLKYIQFKITSSDIYTGYS